LYGGGNGQSGQAGVVCQKHQRLAQIGHHALLTHQDVIAKVQFAKVVILSDPFLSQPSGIDGEQ
jgi:hypothetical protein